MIKKLKLHDIAKFLRLFAKYLRIHLKDTMILRVAAALSYTTLIAVVPLMAIALAIFSAFPVYGDIRAQVQDFLIHYFVPDIGQNIQNYMIEFIGASAKLTTLGVVGIAVTAILLLSTIENSFNFIFKVKRHRSIATKITLYWTIITLCPLLLGAAFSLKGYIVTIKYFSNDSLTDFNFLTSVILQNVLTFSVLLLSYIVVPNKKVRFSSAFSGAFVAFLSIMVLRHGFGYFLILNVTYKTLYGALASFPILLIWMYSWWTTILFGAVFTSVLEEFRNKKRLWK
ncbi:MAG: YihY family inner membrane protein [Alphaproteobacteria bacterium]|nr:YihY family inner membrane protein [Alphaproteobacteria bacterium]